MAGIAHLGNFCQYRIHIAVCRQRLDILVMSAGLSLDPKLLTASAVISHLSGMKRRLKSLFIHISHHQHLSSLIILDNDWHMSVRILLKISPMKRRFKRIHFYSIPLAQRFDCRKLSCILINGISRDPADSRGRKNLYQFIERNFREQRQYLGMSVPFVQAFPQCRRFHQNKFIDKFFQKPLVFQKRFHPRITCCYLFFAESFGYFFRKLDIFRFGIVQSCLFAACI